MTPAEADKDEALREALLELARLREREAAAREESEALLDGLASMNAAGSPARAMAALLASIRGSLACDAAALLAAEGEGAAIREATDPRLPGLAAPVAAAALARPIRVADTARLAGWEAAPPALRAHRALLSVPFALPDGRAGALLCLARATGAFAPAQQRLLARLSALAAQGLAALALAERNALLAAVIDGASAGVAIADATDPALPLVYVNDAFVALAGHPREEALGRNCRFLSAEPPDSPERTRLRETVAARAPGTFELLNRRADGSTFWNRLTLYPVADARGRVTHLVATQTDVTAERAAADERDAARRRLISALSATAQGFLVLDPAGVVVFANPAWRGFFDPEGDLFAAGESFVAAWAARLERAGTDPETAARRAAARLDALFAGATDAEEALPDGRVLLVQDRPTEDGGAVSIAADVTALKATERALAQRAAAIDAAQDGVAVTDEGGRFVYMNPAHLALFGYEREAEVLGRPWSVLYPPDQAEVIERQAMPELMRSGRWRGEVGGLRRDGGPVEQEVSLTWLDGIGIVCVTRDVSARRRDERERARLRDQLQIAQRQEAVGQLAAGVAHDFNNLLSVIGASTAMLEPALAGDPEARGHLDRVAGAAGRAAGLVRRLTDLGGRRGTETGRVDLRDVVREAADLLRAGVPGRVALETTLPDAPVEVEANATELLQVLLNLGINGRDALGPEGGRLALRLVPDAPTEGAQGVVVGALARGRRYAALEVVDDGAGMDDAQRARVFRPYYTTKGDAGTGLGLVVVSSVVGKASGAVGVVSAPGEGSAFTVYWPLDPPEAAAAPPPAAPDDAAALEDARDVLAGRLVLVCDDLPEVGRGIAALLERAGAEAAVCEDPRDALDALREDPASWGLLLTDHDMPGMTGTELAAAARAAAPDLPVVLCSAWAEALRGGGEAVDAVLAKPLTPESLGAAVRRALAARRAAAAARAADAAPTPSRDGDPSP